MNKTLPNETKYEYRRGYIDALEEVLDAMINETRSPRRWLIHIKKKIDLARGAP